MFPLAASEAAPVLPEVQTAMAAFRASSLNTASCSEILDSAIPEESAVLVAEVASNEG